MKQLETLQFKKFCMSIGNLPSTYVDSLSYYECLMWLCKFLEEQVIPTVNNNSEAVTELQGLFIELKSYIDTYFDNLDVQEEINNKLDEMAEDGQLADIISQYLNSTAIFAYDNVASMKEAINLVDGSYTRTLGYYTKNDGGGGLYKIRHITNDDVVDEGLIIEIDDSGNDLIAELIIENKVLNVKQLGAKGDGSTDDYQKIQNGIYYTADNNIELYIPAGTYIIGQQLATVTSASDPRVDSNFVITGEGKGTIINKPQNSAFTEMFDFNYVNNLMLKNIQSDNLSLTLVPNSIYTQGYNVWTRWLEKKNFDFENTFGTGDGVSKLITLQAPTVAGRYGDKHYNDYPLRIVSNSGYNAIEIDNFGYNLEDTTSTPPDNSAIGIIDNITNSTGVLLIDMHGQRSFERYLRSAASIQSDIRPGTVFEVSQNGHIGIGCSTDYNDSVAYHSTAAIKIRDDSPRIDFFDHNNPSSNGSSDGSIQVTFPGSEDERLSALVRGNKVLDLSTKGMVNTKLVQNAQKTYNKLITLILTNGSGTERTKYITIDDSRDNLHYGTAGDSSDPIIPRVKSVANPTASGLYNYAVKGNSVFNETTGKPMWYDGTKWVYADGTDANIT